MHLLSLPVLLLITDSNAHFLRYKKFLRLSRVREANLVNELCSFFYRLFIFSYKRTTD